MPRVNRPSSGQVIQFLDAMNDFLREATDNAVQRLIEGIDLLKCVAYGEEPLPDLRKRLDFGFLTFVNYGLSTLEMAGLSLCDLGKNFKDANLPQYWDSDSGSTFIVPEFVRFTEMDLHYDLIELLDKRGFRTTRVPEFLCFLGGHCGRIPKGSRAITLGFKFLVETDRAGFLGKPEELFLGAFWEKGELYVEWVPKMDLHSSDVFLVVKTK